MVTVGTALEGKEEEYGDTDTVACPGLTVTSLSSTAPSPRSGSLSETVGGNDSGYRDPDTPYITGVIPFRVYPV